MSNLDTVRSNPPVHLKVAEAATYLGVSERTLRTWIAEKKLRFVKIGSRIILRRIDLDRYVETHLQDASA